MSKSIYIHIPFCVSKCHYCDFNSYADKSHLVERYVSSLLVEISSFKSDSDIQTIFFGGGTPSYLSPVDIQKIVQAVKDNFNCTHVSEVTLETNPETIESIDSFLGYRQSGINRISLGAQSFNNDILTAMNRPHRADKIAEVVNLARLAGFDNLNLDMIFGYPKQTIDIWIDSLEKAINLNPEHLSLYGLTVEPGTPLYTTVKQKQDIPAEDDTVLEMYQYAMKRITQAGFIQYEISNFSLQSRECQHNINYWKNGEYFGFGAGAHSYINGRRYWNIRSVDEYVKRVESSSAIVAGEETLEGNKKIAESAMLALRLRDGIDCIEFQNRYQINPEILFKKALTPYQEAGLVNIENNHIRLTEQGLYLSDMIFAELVG